MEFTAEITLNNRYRQAAVSADWIDGEEGHMGYWDFTVTVGRSAVDVSQYVSKDDTRRLERRAQALADESWQCAYEDPADWN